MKYANWHIVINAVLFQGIWFSIMMFEQRGLLFFLSALVAQFFYQRHVLGNTISISLPVKLFVFGVLMDFSFTSLGFFSFPSSQFNGGITDIRLFNMPIWLMILWLGFVLTLQHSLQWIRAKKYVCMIAFSLFGTMSYLAGRRFDVIQFSNEMILCLLLGWLVVGWISSINTFEKTDK